MSRTPKILLLSSHPHLHLGANEQAQFVVGAKGCKRWRVQRLIADILSVQATLWSNFTHCVSVD